MKTKYQILPFYGDIKETSLFQSQALNSSLRSNFKVYTEFDRLIPFICEIGSDYNFEILVKDFDGSILGQIKKNQIIHKVFTSGGKSYLVYFGDRIGCLELGECKTPYMVQIGSFYSEWFWVANNTDSLLKIEIGNSTDFSFIPYSLGFKQKFWIESTLGTAEVDSFSVSSRDSKGRTTTTYQKLTETYNLYLNNVPAYLKQVFQSFEVLDSVTLTYKNNQVTCEEKQAKITSKRNELGFTFYDIQVSILSDSYEEIGVCEQSKFTVTNYEVSIPSETDCVSFNSIETVEVDCNVDSIEEVLVADCDADNDINGVDIDCTPDTEIEEVIVDCNNDCTDEKLLFYATVIY